MLEILHEAFGNSLIKLVKGKELKWKCMKFWLKKVHQTEKIGHFVYLNDLTRTVGTNIEIKGGLFASIQTRNEKSFQNIVGKSILAFTILLFNF